MLAVAAPVGKEKAVAHLIAALPGETPPETSALRAALLTAPGDDSNKAMAEALAGAPDDADGLRMILLSLLVVSLIATGVSVASFFVPGAVVAALFVALFYGLLVSVKVYDRHEWAHKLITGEPLPPRPVHEHHEMPDLNDFGDEPEPSGMEIEPDVSPAVVAAERAGFKLGLEWRF